MARDDFYATASLTSGGDVHHASRPSELEDYDFLRATYEALLRAARPDPHAIGSAFEALEAAHDRLRSAHLRRFGARASH